MIPLSRRWWDCAKGAECSPAGESGQCAFGGCRRLGRHGAQAAGAGPTRGAAGLDAELRGATACRHKVAFVLSLGVEKEELLEVKHNQKFYLLLNKNLKQDYFLTTLLSSLSLSTATVEITNLRSTI